MSTLKNTRDVTDIAGRHIEHTLESGKKLANMVLDRTRVSRVRTLAFLGEHYEEEKIKKFAEGGILTGEGGDRWLIPILKEHLSKSLNNIVVLEESLALPGDRVLEKIKARKFSFENQLYHWLDHHDSSSESIAQLLRMAGRYPRIGLLCSPKQETLACMRGGNVDERTLLGLRDSTLSFFIGVYDEESYLLVDFI